MRVDVPAESKAARERDLGALGDVRPVPRRKNLMDPVIVGDTKRPLEQRTVVGDGRQKVLRGEDALDLGSARVGRAHGKHVSPHQFRIAGPAPQDERSQPERCDPAMTALVDERVLLIEGTLGMPDWHLVRDGDP